MQCLKSILAFAAACSVLIAGTVFAQVKPLTELESAPQRGRSEVNDPLRNLSSSQFFLRGKYLVPPRSAKPSDFPALVVRCSTNARNRSEAAHFIAGRIFADRSSA
jgi:hypothetical protein